MGEQNAAAPQEPGTWMLMHWQDEPQPERVLYLHDEADDGGDLPPGAVVYQPATQNLRTVNPSRLKPLPAAALRGALPDTRPQMLAALERATAAVGVWSRAAADIPEERAALRSLREALGKIAALSGTPEHPASGAPAQNAET